jgi:hypothetical protein
MKCTIFRATFFGSYLPDGSQVSSIPFQVLIQKGVFLSHKRSFLRSLFFSKKNYLFSFRAFHCILG